MSFQKNIFFLWKLLFRTFFFSYFMPYISPRPFKSYFFQASTKLDALGKNIKVLDDGSFSLLMRKEIAFWNWGASPSLLLSLLTLIWFAFLKKSAYCGKTSSLIYLVWLKIQIHYILAILVNYQELSFKICEMLPTSDIVRPIGHRSFLYVVSVVLSWLESRGRRNVCPIWNSKAFCQM